LASQLRTVVLQHAMGWIDLGDTTTLRCDPPWQLACSDARGTTPLAQNRRSQATLSLLLTCLGRDDNIDTVHEGLLRLAIWRLTSLNSGERPKHLTLDIDGLPIAFEALATFAKDVQRYGQIPIRLSNIFPFAKCLG
jgi:hypothetical protein